MGIGFSADTTSLIHNIDQAQRGLHAAYMLSIITCPKPEQLTCVAPSMSRAKS